ncbi:hypothetical protein ACL9RL_02500 [Plantibacter sp. Mn2098]|uniref:hypothetical protein n=1 Tax=Plantibacter sp. Mn2098 TaxID=3395266 RepID=UPI003BE804DB
MIPQHGVYLGVDPLDELSAQLHSAVMLDDLVLDKVERKVTRVADALLTTPAEEVEVLATKSSNRALNQHPLCV